MAKYRKGPIAKRAMYDEDDWHAETHGRDVYVSDDTHSEDQPTGILTADGKMIWRMAHRIGFRLGGEDEE